MTIILIILAIAAFLSTLGGGYFALRFKDKSHLILGFSAGAVIGVAFFDLLPEALEVGQSYGSETLTIALAVGFILYLVIDRFFHLHSHSRAQHSHHDHTVISENSKRGILRASSFSFHSFLDGLGIGLAFQVSSSLGIIVAVAVLAHDFSDGINTVSAIMKSAGSRKDAIKWLLLDASAPVLGIISTMFFSIPTSTLGLCLAVFCGFFLYIGASDLVPESFHSHPTKWTTIMTICGALFIFLVIKIAG